MERIKKEDYGCPFDEDLSGPVWPYENPKSGPAVEGSGTTVERFHSRYQEDAEVDVLGDRW